jgi:ribonuclease P protein component
MLSKVNRLVKTADFQEIYRSGKYVVGRHMVIYYQPNLLQSVRVGFVASKKVGASHVRNRCKRILREAMRQLLPDLPSGYDLIVVARPPLAEQGFQDILGEMAKLLRKANLMEREQ